MYCHCLEVAVAWQSTLRVKGKTLQELCCYVVGVPLMSVGCVVKRMTLMLVLMACAQQDQVCSLLCLPLHLHNQSTGMTVIMGSST